MNSQAVEKKLGLEAAGWKRWSNLDIRRVPSSIGVYVFRFAGGLSLQRVSGSSDIVYVGQGIIRDRLRAHGDPDWTEWKDSGWLIFMIAGGKELEVAWQEMSENDARSAEAEILEEYLVDHRELPPANRQMPTLSPVTRGIIILLSLSEHERLAVIDRVTRAGHAAG